MMKRNLFKIFFLNVFFLSIFTGAFPLWAASDAPEVINFQLRWHHQFQFAGYYAAIEKGYYLNEGLDVRLHEGAPGKAPVDEVLAGRAEYAEANSELLYARLKGKPLVALAAIFQHSPSILIARKDDKIYSPHDLIGKKIMLMSKQFDADFVAMFSREGIKENSIEIIPSSYNIEDLISGKVSAFNSYMTNEPYFLKQRGFDFTVIDPSTYGIDFYSDVLFTSEQEIDEHPQRVAAFRRATLQGWRYAMDHPDEIIDLLVNKYNVPKSKEHLEFEAKTMRQLIFPDLIEIGTMNPGRWQNMATAFSEAGMLDGEPSIEGFLYDPNPRQDVGKLKTVIFALSLLSAAALLVVLGLYIGQLRLKKEIVLRKIAEENVRKLAYIDTLTGIPNRNTFIPYASKQFLLAQRSGEKVALCFIDLNSFKQINDQYGHSAGDCVLQHVANAIASEIRGSDMVARFGGDEFVVLLSGVKDINSINCKRSSNSRLVV
jgi:ABC-type nitrate/sulfonate/bicarbonate transport system substrate-binding protein